MPKGKLGLVPFGSEKGLVLLRMSLIIDLILVAVFAFFVIFYMKKGLVHSIVGFARFWIALGIAIAFSGLLADALQPLISEKIGNGDGESFMSAIVQSVVSSGYVARVLSFALLFAVAFVAVKLLELLLRPLVKLPVIHFMNNALGAVLGVLVGFLWLQLLSIVFMAAAELLSGSISWLTPESFDSTILAKFLYEHNLFRLLFESLTAG